MSLAPTTSPDRSSLPAARRRTAPLDAATAAIVAAHLGLVRGLAGKLIRSGTARYVEHDELVSVGTEALIESIGRFDPTTGAQFGTFAFPRIRGAMIDAIAQLAPVPRGAYRGARRREADGRTGLFVASLDAMAARGAEPASPTTDPDRGLDLQHMRDRLAGALDRLPVRKRRFIEAHYFGERDLQSIGREMGLSKSWASRLHSQAIAELRDALGFGPEAAAVPAGAAP